MQLPTIIIISLKVLRMVSCSTLNDSQYFINLNTYDLKTICQLGFIAFHKAVWSGSHFLLLQQASTVQYNSYYQ